MASTAYAEQKKTEGVTAHVLWMTTGLSCEGDSVAMTSATNPSLEDIILQAIPGMPKVIFHWPLNCRMRMGAGFRPGAISTSNSTDPSESCLRFKMAMPGTEPASLKKSPEDRVAWASCSRSWSAWSGANACNRFVVSRFWIDHSRD